MINAQITAHPPEICSPGLLVSVRNAVEAEVALGGGADWIDVKEPTRGALGAADPQTIQSVIQTVAGRTPVSVAVGEFQELRSVRLLEPIVQPEAAGEPLEVLLELLWTFPNCSAVQETQHCDVSSH